MLSLRSKTLITLGVLLFCGVALATYYKPDFFPIGLTGINPTGDWNCPYYDKRPGKWLWSDEKALIEALGVNCIGCEDAWHNYLIDFAEVRTGNTYIEEVLTELTDSAGNPTVYLITATYGAAPKRFDKNMTLKYNTFELQTI